MDEGTSDYDLVMEWYLLYGERGVTLRMDEYVGPFIWGLKYRRLLEDTTPGLTTFNFQLTPKALQLIKGHQNEN